MPRERKEAETVIRVKVLPRSSKCAISGKVEGAYRIKLTAPPVKGKANQALIGFLAKKTGLPKRNIEIISGKQSRNKTVRIKSPWGKEVLGCLNGNPRARN